VSTYAEAIDSVRPAFSLSNAMQSQTVSISQSAAVTDTSADELRRRLIRDADTCVACGMCLPVCPTYVETRTEAESARGRIALVRGLAEGRLEAGAALVAHLERCLQCQACEAVCPAAVPYGRLMDGAHALMRQTGAAEAAGAADRIAWFLRTPQRLSLLGSLLSFYRVSGIQWLARHSGLLHAAGLADADRLAAAPHAPREWAPYYPAQGTEQGQVALFTGCIARLVDGENLQAAISVLRKLGYGVHVPPGQGCCGAVDLHAGRGDEYRQAAERNTRAFEDLDVEAVVSIASGCTAVLQQTARDAVGLPPVRDISDFLLHVDWPEHVRIRPADLDVYLHTPCSLKNAVRKPQAPAQLLERIPGLRIRPAPADAQCCGAAGTYSLRYPETAQRLGEQALAHARQANIATIATSNVGCALHMAAVAKGQGEPVRMLHPVRLLDEHLDASHGRSDN